MFIAQELRKNNIAEYLLYMWQVEDTIRAFDCSLTRIKREYVERFDYTEEQKEEEIDWFGNLIRMMNQEGCREKGHLQINKVTLQMLIELNDQLLQSSKFPFYNTELRLQKKEISPDTAHAVKEISTFIGMLSDYYKKDKEEGLKFE